MGLDISYYSRITKMEKSSEYFDVIYIYPQTFIYHLGSLECDSCYISTENSKYNSFRAGSYSGYNDWRNNLAEMAGYGCAENVWKDFPNIRYLKLKKIEGEEAKIKPFYELIFFSDCEGCIGPEIAKKLYKDFCDFDEQAKKFNKDPLNIEPDDWFYIKYCAWKEAFRVASDSGIVLFH